MSKAERVLPPGRRDALTGGGAGRPCASSRLAGVPPELAMMSVFWRNGWFVALDDDVPPTPQFQNTPTPPRTVVRPSPLRSYAKPNRGPKSALEYVCRYRPTWTPLMTASGEATTNMPVDGS